MIPIVTPEEMAAVDQAAPEPVEVLVDRAGAAVAWEARRLLGGTYGRRVAVLAGRGNNGADGRSAAARLARWGARVQVLDAADTTELPPADLVIDAAYGTGLSRPFHPPATTAAVLAVDIPSGVDGLTGAIPGDALAATTTVTFQALKPGLLLPPGGTRVGRVSVADIGLDVSGARCHLVEGADVGSWLPVRPVDAHKWRSACWVIAGSPGMTGAASLAASGAARAGAGYVRLSTPGGTPDGPAAVVVQPMAAENWGGELADAERIAAMVIGPGLGRDDHTGAQIRAALVSFAGPAVVDADALIAVAGHLDVLRNRKGPTVLTPHDGEFEALTGCRPPPDRIDGVRRLASDSGSVVLLKGPATVVAGPGGDVLVSTTGDQRLATAGSGDVLSGLVGALLAQGVPPLEAAGGGAWVHGRAAEACPRRGMVASDLPEVLPEVLDATDMG